MHKTHVIKLNPTKTQKIFFNKSCGVARFAYNWALNKWETDYQNGIRQSAYDLIKYLNSIKKEQFPWMQETAKTCSQYAIHNLEHAYKNMWELKSGYPKFKKKGGKDCFVAIEKHSDFRQENLKIRIPRLGWVKCCESLRFEGKINNVKIKRVADMWFAVISVNMGDDKQLDLFPNENQVRIGIDLGIKTMITLSDGTIYQNPKALKRNLKSLKRLQRSLSRKAKDSKNRYKQRMKVARKHYKISCIRDNAIHQTTTEIINKYDVVVVETLRTANMMKNHKLAQALSDVSFGSIVNTLQYKAKWNGKIIIKADQWFASSKICSNCNNKKEKLSLKNRVYKCEICGFTDDRDLNAAKNLAKYSPTEESRKVKSVEKV